VTAASAFALRSAQPQDWPAVLALNAESVQFLSPMTPQRLEALDRASALHLVLQASQGVAAFLLAFREGADYDSVNYRWFAQRYPRFLYVDRVVVAPAFRGQGGASLLYREVFAAARRDAVPCVTCEFDIDPPNPISERFHAHFGFQEVGRQPVPYAQKEVSLQLARV
jgi:predicted GNAT superfamily acetyltransferase